MVTTLNRAQGQSAMRFRSFARSGLRAYGRLLRFFSINLILVYEVVCMMLRNDLFTVLINVDCYYGHQIASSLTVVTLMS